MEVNVIFKVRHMQRFAVMARGPASKLLVFKDVCDAMRSGGRSGGGRRRVISMTIDVRVGRKNVRKSAPNNNRFLFEGGRCLRVRESDGVVEFADNGVGALHERAKAIRGAIMRPRNQNTLADSEGVSWNGVVSDSFVESRIAEFGELVDQCFLAASDAVHVVCCHVKVVEFRESRVSE